MCRKEHYKTMPEIGVERPIETPIQEVKPATKVIPKREIDRKAEELKAKRTLPPIPGNNVDFDTMIQWLGLLTEDMWKQTIVRVYRHDPVINNELITKDAPNYIDVIGSMFDLDYMIEHHGGGKYGFFVNGGDGSKKLFESRLTIPVAQYDPKFDIRALDVNAKDNIKWVNWARMKGLLDKDNRPVDAKKGDTTTIGNSPAESIANAVLAGIDKATQIMSRNQQRNNNNDDGGLGNTIGTILVEKMKQDDPNRSMESFAKMASMFKSDNNSDLFKLMLQMNDSANARMDAANARMMEVLRELRPSNREKDDDEDKPSPISQLKELLEIGEQLGLKVGGRTGSRSGWDTAVDVAKDILPPVFNMVSQIIHSSSLAKSAATPPITNPNPNPPPTPGQSALAPAITSYATMGANANPSPEEKLPPPPVVTSASPESIPSVTPDAVITSPQIAEIQVVLRTSGGLIQKQILDKVTGYDFAETLVKMFGPIHHGRVAKHGVEIIIEGMKTIPEFYSPIVDAYGEEYLFNWVGEFINYEEIIRHLDRENDIGDDFDLDDEPDDTAPEKTIPIGGGKK